MSKPLLPTGNKYAFQLFIFYLLPFVLTSSAAIPSAIFAAFGVYSFRRNRRRSFMAGSVFVYKRLL
jgi:hypothetical protein